MNRKDYIERAKNLIVNRVKFHAPVVYDAEIDSDVLAENGLDTNLPIFKFDKVLNKRLIKAFELAQKECNFNVIFSFDSLNRLHESSLKKIKNYLIYSKYSSSKLIKNINKLNINYMSNSNFNLKFSKKYFRINNTILNPHFDNFSLSQMESVDGVMFAYREFVLNGNNTLVKFINTTEKLQKIECEFNFPLRNGYYLFKKQDKNIKIENIKTREVLYFNFKCKNAKFNFSSVDGLENSKFCCVNINFSITLKPKNIDFVFFNFGNEIINLKNFNSAVSFYQLSQKKLHEIFDIKVKTKNAEFDDNFNISLPKKIWLSWANFENAEGLVEKYQTYRKLFASGNDKIVLQTFKQLGLREILIFNGKSYKKVVVVKSNEKFLQIGKTCFYGVNSISKKSLMCDESFAISFGF